MTGHSRKNLEKGGSLLGPTKQYGYDHERDDDGTYDHYMDDAGEGAHEEPLYPLQEEEEKRPDPVAASTMQIL
eukprot:573423-Prorocentrum_lima.AAC.1